MRSRSPSGLKVSTFVALVLGRRADTRRCGALRAGVVVLRERDGAVLAGTERPVVRGSRGAGRRRDGALVLADAEREVGEDFGEVRFVGGDERGRRGGAIVGVVISGLDLESSLGLWPGLAPLRRPAQGFSLELLSAWPMVPSAEPREVGESEPAAQD